MASSVTPTVPDRPSGKRWLRYVLFASLALNALVVGGIVSAFVRHGGPLMMSSAATPNNVGAFVGTLPSERRGTIFKATGDKRRAMMPLRRDVRLARRDMLATLSAEPFDREVFAAAQTRLIEAENRQRIAYRDLLTEVVGQMTAEERRAYIRWRGPPRGPLPGEEDEPPQSPPRK